VAWRAPLGIGEALAFGRRAGRRSTSGVALSRFCDLGLPARFRFRLQ
jgi:hypothetical protein